jgi:hypothetical protein
MSLRESKKLPIVVAWGKQRIHIGELEFLKNGSLVFESRFHNTGPTTEFGVSNLKDNRFSGHSLEKVVQVNRGFHITLHPPESSSRGVMHFREHHPGNILFRREIDWFPAVAPFNLIRLFTMPLDMCSFSPLKQVTIDTSIDHNYQDSLELVVDIFPLDTQTVHSYPNAVEVWGHCPDYGVRLSIMLAKQRTPALLYWPEDDELSL